MFSKIVIVSAVVAMATAGLILEPHTTQGGARRGQTAKHAVVTPPAKQPVGGRDQYIAPAAPAAPVSHAGSAGSAATAAHATAAALTTLNETAPPTGSSAVLKPNHTTKPRTAGAAAGTHEEIIYPKYEYTSVDEAVSPKTREVRDTDHAYHENEPSTTDEHKAFEGEHSALPSTSSASTAASTGTVTTSLAVKNSSVTEDTTITDKSTTTGATKSTQVSTKTPKLKAHKVKASSTLVKTSPAVVKTHATY